MIVPFPIFSPLTKATSQVHLSYMTFPPIALGVGAKSFQASLRFYINDPKLCTSHFNSTCL
jgi:hypothetical protein